MTVAASAAIGASQRVARASQLQDSTFGDSLLETLESEEFNWGVLGASATWTAGAAATTSLAAGVGLKAAAIAAGAALGTFAAVGVLGAAAFAGGVLVGEALGDTIIGGLFGQKPVTTTGDVPARKGDPIAHANKDAAAWGAILGAALVIGVGIATCGAGLVVMAAAVAVSGVAGGLIAGVASKAGQYGEDTGTIAQGSPNVFFEGKAVARVGDTTICSRHNSPGKLAEGVATVFVNGRSLVRLGHRTICDANVNGGCSTIAVSTASGPLDDAFQDGRSKELRWAAVIIGLLPLPRGQSARSAAANTRFLDDVSTTWREHEDAVLNKLQDNLGRDIAPKVYLEVDVPGDRKYTVIPDALERKANGSFEIHEAKFSNTKDLASADTNLRSTFTTNQKAAFDAISRGDATVTLRNSTGGRQLLGDQFLPGAEIRVQPSINVYVNTPDGVILRKWP